MISRNCENYIHRIGQLGRFGRKAVAINVSDHFNPSWGNSEPTCCSLRRLTMFVFFTILARRKLNSSLHEHLINYYLIPAEQFYSTQIVRIHDIQCTSELLIPVFQDEIPVNIVELI